jgi:hypothetical protein
VKDGVQVAPLTGYYRGSDGALCRLVIEIPDHVDYEVQEAIQTWFSDYVMPPTRTLTLSYEPGSEGVLMTKSVVPEEGTPIFDALTAKGSMR